jgi:hypothetical protein
LRLGVCVVPYAHGVPLALQNSKRSADPQQRPREIVQVGPLLGSIEAARTRANLLFANGHLNRVADEIASCALAQGHTHVHGSSVFGHMLVGAVVSRCPDLVPWVPGTDANVLLVDGPLAGTAGILQAAHLATVTGARSVDALTVGTTVKLDAPKNCDIGSIWTLNPDCANPARANDA